MDVGAEDATPVAAPLLQPKRRISVQQYRPKAQDFITNLDAINTQLFGLRRVEPPICEQMRKSLTFNLKLFHEIIFKDNKRFMATAMTSQSAKLNETIYDVQKADTQVLTDLGMLADSYLKEINTKCASLGSVNTTGEISKKVDELRTVQLGTAIQLAGIPQKFENEMQSNYVPVENIVGTV